DDADVCTSGDVCDENGTCAGTITPGIACDDADACTSVDACDAAGKCTGRVATLQDLGCTLGALQQAPCGEEVLPKALARATDGAVQRIERLVAKAKQLNASAKAERAEKLRKRAELALDAVGKKIDKAAASRKTSKHISATCHDALQALVVSRRAI